MARRSTGHSRRGLCKKRQRPSKTAQTRGYRLYQQEDGAFARETRVLGKDELQALGRIAVAGMALLQQRWEKHKDVYALLGALFFLKAQLPQWLLGGLCDLLTARLPSAPRDWVRWNLVLALRDVSRLKWTEVFSEAAKLLYGTDAAGRPETIRKSYERVERNLPPQRRRPRRHRLGPPR